MTDIWQGEQIRLRAVEPRDWEQFEAWNHDVEMQRGVDQLYFPKSRERARRWAEEAANRGADGDHFLFAIENKAGYLVGSISTHAAERRHGTFKLGLALGREYRRSGYGAEAVRLVLRFFFTELRYQKVTVHIYSFNEPSVRFFTRLGFQPEGRIRRAIFTDGAYHDELLYGLTVEEFMALGG